MSIPEPQLIRSSSGSPSRLRKPHQRADAQDGRPPTAGPALMTAAGLEQLQIELETLRRRSSEEMAQRLRDARSYGNDSNNDEYYALREEQMVIEARIASLEDTVRRASVVAEDLAADGVAAIGSVLCIEDLGSGNISRYRLAGAHQQLERGAISTASPMGQALMGARAGAVVTVDLPNGRSLNVLLVAVEADDTGQ
jgi:transcription elongation factor GreA